MAPPADGLIRFNLLRVRLKNLIKPAAQRVQAMASTPIAASGWTAGRRGACASRGRPTTTGASCGWACRESCAAWTSIRRSSRETSLRRARSTRATSRRRRRRTIWRARRGARSSRARRSTATRTISSRSRRRCALRIFVGARYPDGGVARLRAYGDASPDWDRLRAQGDVDLAAAAHGGIVAGCSDA